MSSDPWSHPITDLHIVNVFTTEQEKLPTFCEMIGERAGSIQTSHEIDDYLTRWALDKNVIRSWGNLLTQSPFAFEMEALVRLSNSGMILRNRNFEKAWISEQTRIHCQKIHSDIRSGRDLGTIRTNLRRSLVSRDESTLRAGHDAIAEIRIVYKNSGMDDIFAPWELLVNAVQKNLTLYGTPYRGLDLYFVGLQRSYKAHAQSDEFNRVEDGFRKVAQTLGNMAA